MILHYQPYELPFKDTFTISKGSKTHQPTLLVALELGPYMGFGEAPAISYYNVTVEQMMADLEANRRMVEKFAFTDPERYWHYLHHLMPRNPFLICALDMAGWDLFGKMRRQPLYKLWETSPATAPVTDFTIGIDTVDRMIEKIKQNPWPVYKIKVGNGDDVATIAALRQHTDAPFRVDANGGWSLEEALEIIPKLAGLGVELVEQPLHHEDKESMRELYTASPLPLFADESCVKEQDVAACVGCFHGINIKLTKCSGITPARRMISHAKELGLKVMLGCMNESTVGSAALAHLMPQADYADVDGPLLLSKDIATGLTYHEGVITPSVQPGLGIDLLG